MNVLGDAEFVSVTYRLFKLPKRTVSCACEMTYKGDIMGAEEQFKLDYKYTFQVRTAVLIVDHSIRLTWPQYWNQCNHLF